MITGRQARGASRSAHDHRAGWGRGGL